MTRVFYGGVRLSRLDLPFLGVERITYRDGERLLQENYSPENAFLIQIQLDEGMVSIRDLRQTWSGILRAPVDRISFRIGFDDLRNFATRAGRPEFTVLRCGVGLRDASLHGLAQALVPTLEQPEQASSLFLEQIGFATLVYVTQTYGGLHFPSHRKGGLSAQQETRVTEFLTTNLTKKFTLKELAEVCGLSKSYFSKAFRQTFGKTPGQWVTEYRVACACSLLRTGMPIAQIAVACGFTDQSHLTRVFSDLMHQTPGQWRRALVCVDAPSSALELQVVNCAESSGENRFAPVSRRNANHTRADAREMALIYEATGIGNRAERQ